MKNILLLLLILLDVISVYSQTDTLYYPVKTIISIKDSQIKLDEDPSSKLTIIYQANFDSIPLNNKYFRPQSINLKRTYKCIFQERIPVTLSLKTEKEIETILCEKDYYVKGTGNVLSLQPLFRCVIFYNPDLHKIEDCK